MASATILEVEEGTVVFRENDLPDFLYLVLEGEISLTKETADEPSVDIALLGPGEYFGELSLLDGGPRSTSARARIPGKLARLDLASFNEALSGAPVETFRALVSRISSQLRSANDLLLAETVRKAKMELVGEMASTIVHDLQSPFTIIGLACETIESRIQDPDTKHLCGVIETQLGRMTTMVREILDFAKGTPKIRRQAIHVAHLFETFAAYNKMTLEAKGLALDIHPMDTIVSCDKEKILRVLQNLFNNAADAMGETPGQITLSAGLHGDRIELTLADNGPGIPKAIQATLFDPFVTMNKSKGTGLGLAIVRSVITAHGGEITFETELNVGTTFKISLPVQELA